MASFGDVAVRAAELYQTGPYLSPRQAWDEAAKQLLSTASLREKSCPRATFLSLCGDGKVAGIPPGSYTQAQENRTYAREAVNRLSHDPGLAASTPRHLWKLVSGEGGPKYNEQMDVVLALWKNRLIHPGQARLRP